jgi:uncharacterized tellurite resistance protein B-like protein
MFFKKKTTNFDKTDYLKVAALLIHAAKIDENYSKNEESIIKRALIKIGADDKIINDLIESAKKVEENANQILDFTREVKKMDNDIKIKIVETLWQIIYSDKKADVYETSLMRRIAGLLYIDNKIMGDIKEKIKSEIPNDLSS